MNYCELYKITSALKTSIEMMSQCMNDPVPKAKLEQEIAVLLESLKPILE